MSKVKRRRRRRDVEHHQQKCDEELPVWRQNAKFWFEYVWNVSSVKAEHHCVKGWMYRFITPVLQHLQLPLDHCLRRETQTLALTESPVATVKQSNTVPAKTNISPLSSGKKTNIYNKCTMVPGCCHRPPGYLGWCLVHKASGRCLCQRKGQPLKSL